jgi:hypothetical protein
MTVAVPERIEERLLNEIPEMHAEAMQANEEIVEVPAPYRQRMEETNLNPLRDRLLITGVILRLMRNYEPPLFFGGPKLIFVLSGTLLGMRAVIDWLTSGVITHLASVTLSAVLMMTGAQLLSLGLVADMIKRH